MITVTTKKLASEFLGTLLLLAIVVGSGIMGDRLSRQSVYYFFASIK